MADFAITTTYSGIKQDTRWRISKHGEENARPGTLDVESFASVVGAVNEGYIPSGTGVAFNATSGKYELFTAAEGQVLAGFVNDNDGVKVNGSIDQTFALLVHGIIDATRLPVAAQRTSVLTAASSGAFVFVNA